MHFTAFDFWINLTFSYIATVGFAITINVPHRIINWAGITGTLGWMVYWLADLAGMGRMLSNMLGAFTVGMIGMLMARWQKCPITLFSVPGFVPLVPGLPSYQAVRYMLNGQYLQARASLMRVGIVTASIALGFLLSTLFQEAMTKYLHKVYFQTHKKNKK